MVIIVEGVVSISTVIITWKLILIITIIRLIGKYRSMVIVAGKGANTVNDLISHGDGGPLVMENITTQRKAHKPSFIPLGSIMPILLFRFILPSGGWYPYGTANIIDDINRHFESLQIYSEHVGRLLTRCCAKPCEGGLSTYLGGRYFVGSDNSKLDF